MAISQRDLREVASAMELAKSREEAMDHLRDTVDEMGGLGLWWDKKGFFKTSDRQVLKGVVAREKAYYSDLALALKKVKNADEDAEELLLDLHDKLDELEEEMASSTHDSKLLCRKYQDFVAVRGKIEGKLNRMEAVVVRQQLARTKSDFREAVQEIREAKSVLEESRRENHDLNERFERLMRVNEQLLTQQTELRQENVLIRTLLEDLIRKQGK